MSFAPAISAGLALVVFLFTVVDNFISRRRESDRRDWERLQALSQVMHQGPQAGLWAQKIAIQELDHLKTKRIQVLLLGNEVMAYWSKQNTQVDPTLKSELQTVIDNVRRHLK